MVEDGFHTVLRQAQGTGLFGTTEIFVCRGIFQRVAYKCAAGIGGAAQPFQRNGAGWAPRNPGKPTHWAQGLLLQNICMTKKAPQKKIRRTANLRVI